MVLGICLYTEEPQLAKTTKIRGLSGPLVQLSLISPVLLDSAAPLLSSCTLLLHAPLLFFCTRCTSPVLLHPAAPPLSSRILLHLCCQIAPCCISYILLHPAAPLLSACTLLHLSCSFLRSTWPPTQSYTHGHQHKAIHMATYSKLNTWQPTQRPRCEKVAAHREHILFQLYFSTALRNLGRKSFSNQNSPESGIVTRKFLASLS